ncbi:MAG: HAMP domain-containing sensor histidine kinase [Pseudomonas sp.]
MKDNHDPELDFSTVLASTVHDMKNSLGLLMQSWNHWLERLAPELAESGERGVIEYESLRLNGMLMQMLGLYKLQINQLPLHPDWTDVEELLQEQLARHAEILEARKIHGRCRLDGIELFVLDPELVGSVIGNVINNSIRYTRSAIHLSASPHDGLLLICVNDDGEGYPEHMLGRRGRDTQAADVRNGSTGLGLYFAQCIASMHQRDGRQGYIELANGGELGGGEFRLYLP